MKVTVADRPPSAEGVNVSFTMQFAPASTVDPFVQVVPAAMAKSPALVPPKATVVRSNVPVPPLVSVKVCAALAVFNRWFPKGTGLGVGVACGNTPVPVRFTICVVGLASSVKVTVAA